MIRLLSAFILCSIFFSCTDKSKVPDNIIPKQKMEVIMWDMLQADRFVNEFLPKRGDTTYNDTAVFKSYQSVFNIHKVTREEFLKSYKFYLGRPDIMRGMFDSISVQAQRRRAEVYKKDQKADSLKLRKQKIDSLRNDSLRKPRLDSIRKRLLKR
jgi:hypothetical protein